ncbi:unnamed protein product, partial [Porites evermanni]
HRVGHCLWESSLNAGFLGFGVNIRFPGVTLTSVSPEWVSTSDSLGWVTLTYPYGGYRQHQISSKSGGSQHRNPKGGGRQQQIPRYGCPQNQIPWVGCRQH